MLQQILDRLNEATVTTRSGDLHLTWRVHSVRSAELRRAGYDLLLTAARPKGDVVEATGKKAAELLKSMVLLEEGLVCAGVVGVSEDGGTTWRRCIVHGDLAPDAGTAADDVEVMHVAKLPDAWRKRLAEAVQALSKTGTVEGGGDHGRSFRGG
jgi:hypothetical protein